MDNTLFAKANENTPQKMFLSKIHYKEKYEHLERYYLQYKEEINLTERDDDKNTPLIISVTSKNYDAVRFICEKINKEDINMQNSVRISIMLILILS